MSDFKFDGFSVEELKAAFDKACDPADWKAPINTLAATQAEMKLACAAIEFYPATKPIVAPCTFTDYPHPNALLKMEFNGFKITSEGYRSGPAGP